MATLGGRFVALVGHVLRRAWEEYRRLSTRTQVLIALGLLVLITLPFSADSTSNVKTGGNLKSPSALSPQKQKLKVLTWNVAAINNNPFEYWLTLKDNPKYDELMNNVENFVKEPPTKRDQLVNFVFSEELFEKLAAKMQQVKFENIDQVRELYRNDWGKRKMVTEFLKDPMIGKKRLVSMPDRITNTITTSLGTFYRPTPINCYDGPRFTSISSWFDQWLIFMFETKVTEDGKVPVQLLEKIPRAKYPALSEEEERISIPLQTLVIALFDAVQVRMLNLLVGPDEWQNLRQTICTNLNKKKTEITLNILSQSYSDASIMFLQETAASFLEKAKSTLGKSHFVVAPTKLGSNDQNSLILLHRSLFDVTSVTELTDSAVAILKKTGSPVMPGDLLVITVRDKRDRLYFLASFHGDTNGLATIPVVRAVRQVFKEEIQDEDARFIFGMDANTYEKVKDKSEYQDVSDFVSFFTEKESLASCWGKNMNIKRHTTRNARTYMQPQLAKAAAKSEVETKGDANPKDFVLYQPEKFETILVARDNTGTGGFVEGMVFPTLEFPSDHAIVRVVLQEKIA